MLLMLLLPKLLIVMIVVLLHRLIRESNSVTQTVSVLVIIVGTKATLVKPIFDMANPLLCRARTCKLFGHLGGRRR
eukprot:COSAG03_NODE_13248_length_510_cov_1.111922_1_plen_75_part_10